MPDPQLDALQIYTALAALRASWSGCLVLSVGLDNAGSATAFAAIAAGAVILVCESDANRCRAALRSGACDFIVNTVDEALRVIKNEIRKQNPLAVGLEADVALALEELFDRGVLPKLFLDPRDPDHATGAFFKDRLTLVLAANRWHHHVFQMETSSEVRALDLRLQSTILAPDPRHRWLTTAPRLFPRDRIRHAYLTPAELELLTADR